MRTPTSMEASDALPAASGEREQKPLAWPLAVAVISGLSLGLWVLLYRLVGFIFHF